MKTIAKRPARTANTSSRLVLGLLLGASGWAFSAPAMAQPALAANTSDVRVHYDIPAQPLADALVAYARQSDLRVLSPAERLSGLNANALQGAYTREQALALLLARSGVSAAIVGDTIQIDARTLPQRQSASGADAPLRANEDDSQAAATNAEDLVVTGTRIRGAAPAGANLIVLDRDAIDATGRATLQDVIQTLPQNFAGSQNEFTQEGTFNARSNFTWASTVDLRGLGADATLTLVNGRRLAPAGVGNFVDSHIVLRGIREDGRDLILPRGFIQHEFRNLARDAATDRLGVRSRNDERLALQREALIHGPTRLDKLIANQLDENRVVRIADLRAPNNSPDLTDALKARARELKNMGLATEIRRNVLQFESGWREALKAMERHLDIRKAMMRARTQNKGRTQQPPKRGKSKNGPSPFGLDL